MKFALLKGIPVLLISLLFSYVAKSQTNSKPIYKDAKASVEARVNDLLGRMTLEEKIAQMRQLSAWDCGTNDQISLEKVRTLTNNLSFGCLEAVDYTSLGYANAIYKIQKYIQEETRLGIPILPVMEGLHGIVQDGATIYPQSIAIGATFSPPLIAKMGDQIGNGMSQMGIKQVLAPDLDLARELRWGRVEETFGEDPFLVSEMGTAYVIALRKHNMICTPKHFIGHGSPLGGLNLASVEGGKRELLSLYLQPFEKVIKRGNPLSIMNSYSSYDGEPMAGSHYMLTELLRNTLGFKGYVYSDWGSIDMLSYFQKTASGAADAARQAVEAGLDLEAAGTDFTKLKWLVEHNKLDVKYIDKAVSNILYAKFESGLFDDKIIEPNAHKIKLHPKEFIELAKDMADESAVLLKNNGILPLQISKIKSLAVIGPQADQVQFGDYTWTRSNEHGVTPLKGLTEKFGSQIKLNYAKGCDLVTKDSAGFAAAVDAATKSDVAVIFVGSQSASLGRDYSNSTSGEGFDLSDLKLTGVQEELIKAVKTAGKPFVVVLVTGKPFAMPWVKENADAVIVQWYAGEQQGNSIADILFGKVNPSGKLPVSFPQSVGHLPVYYNYLPTDKGFYKSPGTYGKPGKDYVFSSPAALWSFGYGLSYTKFAMSDFAVQKNQFEENDTINVKLNIKNIGTVAGKEVVQVYVRDVVSSIVTPIKQLKGFIKVELMPNQISQVTIKIPVSELYLYNKDYKRVVEPGEFEIQVGNSSDNIIWKKTVNVGVDNSIYDKDIIETPAPVVKPAETDQNIKSSIKGSVRDVQSNTLAGVKVSIKGSDVTTTTNSKGAYSIAAKKGDVLIFYKKSYAKTQIVLKDEAVVNVNLKTE